MRLCNHTKNNSSATELKSTRRMFLEKIPPEAQKGET